MLKGIDNVSPDFVYFLIECRSSQWLKFQEECLNNILIHYGEAFTKGKRSEVVEFPSGAADQVPPGIREPDFCRTVFSKLFQIVSQIRKKAPEPEITIDITAAPRMIGFIIAFLAMVLSTKVSRIKLQLVPKGFQADPRFYAPNDSSYFKNLSKSQDNTADMSLASFRGFEKDDEGGTPISIELPMVDVPLLFSRSKQSEDRACAQVVLFRKIPPRDKQMKKSTDMLREMSPKEKSIMNKSIESLATDESDEKEGRNTKPKSGKKIKEIEIEPGQREWILRNSAVLEQLGYVPKKVKAKDEEIKRRQLIWIAKNLAVFGDLGLVELEKKGRGNSAKRTWAGDLISDVVDEKYNHVMHGQTS